MRFLPLIALMTFFASDARAIMNKGDEVPFKYACIGRDVIMGLSEADEVSPEKGLAKFNALIKSGDCFYSPGPFVVFLDRLIHVYTASSGRILEIWKIVSDGEHFIIVSGPHQKSNSI